MEPSGRGRVERRLAAILAADVAGYSRLIGADEGGRVRGTFVTHCKSLRNDIQAAISSTGSDHSAAA